MTTTSDLINETKRHLYSGEREVLNTLDTTVNPTDVTIVMDYDISVGVNIGTLLSIGLELMSVLSVTTSTKTVTVIRGFLGSTAAAHTSADVITINPKFSDFAILRELNNDLADLSSPANGLYQVKTVDLNFDIGQGGYDMLGATDVIEILEIRYRYIGTAKKWNRARRWELARNMPTTDFPSGSGLMIDIGYVATTIRVKYKAAFSPLVSIADDVAAVTGLGAPAHVLPPLGAAVRLVLPRAVKRAFDESQGEPRRAEEIPVNSNVEISQALLALRRQRVNAEAARLAAMHPSIRYIP